MKGKNALGVILAVASIFGVAATTYFCMKETPEANDALDEEIERRKEESEEDTEEPEISVIDKIKVMAPHMKKTLIVGGATVIMIAGGHIVHVVIAGSLAASAGVWKQKYFDIDKTLKKVAPEMHQKVHTAVSKENIEKKIKEATEPSVKKRGKVSKAINEKAKDINRAGESDEEFLVYEEYTDQLFWTTKNRLAEAKLAANERYILGDFVGINDIVKTLGGTPDDDLKKIGWSINNAKQNDSMCYNGLSPWISIRVKAENGVPGVEEREVLVLYYENPPMEYEEALYYQ